MPKIFRAALIPCLYPLLLAGCTTLSPGACLHADWYETGYLVGASGKPVSEALKFQNACVHYGIVPDREAFAEGWVAGSGGVAGD